MALTSPKCVSGTDRCAEVAARLKNTRHIINVQGDEPLVDPLLIAKLASSLREDSSLPMVTAAVPFDKGESTSNPNAVKVVLDRLGNALYFSRSPIPLRIQHQVPAAVRALAQGKARRGRVPRATPGA